MPTVKTDEERGVLGAWAYHARDDLGLKDSAVVHRLGKYDPATIRKAESDSANMSRPLWRALVTLYRTVSEEKGIGLPPAPSFGDPPATPADQSAVVAAIDRQTDAIGRQAGAIEKLAGAIALGFARLEKNTDSRAESITDMLIEIGAVLGVELPLEETAAEGEHQDRPPAKARTKTQPRRVSPPRPGWVEAPEAPELEARTL